MTASSEPIGADEVDALFAPLPVQPGEVCALAVSGGPDSPATMVLFADWLSARGGAAADHWVLTVDHGLRSGSAAEGETVAALARGLGFRHATLAWEGDKPATAIQSSARRARYRLLGRHMRAHGVR